MFCLSLQPSLTQYRNNISETGCQSPTSPHSQSSYSPSQSPGLPSQNWNSSSFEMDPYKIQQQQQTNALQQRFEHFNMVGYLAYIHKAYLYEKVSTCYKTTKF